VLSASVAGASAALGRHQFGDLHRVQRGALAQVVVRHEQRQAVLDRLVGMDEQNVDEISTGEPLMLTVGTATTVGAVTSARDDECEVSLKRPVCAPEGAKIAINRRIGARWRLIGIGTLTTEN